MPVPFSTLSRNELVKHIVARVNDGPGETAAYNTALCSSSSRIRATLLMPHLSTQSTQQHLFA